jgi:CheY-like chemotaxis protein
MDDEPAVLELLAKALARLGYDAHLTESGQDAVQACRPALAQHRPFEVAILDLTVPGGMGGVQALEALRELVPGLHAVVSSGYSRDPILADHRRHGFQGMLPKPYSIGDLARVRWPRLSRPDCIRPRRGPN